MLVNALGLFFVIRGKGTECVAVKSYLRSTWQGADSPFRQHFYASSLTLLCALVEYALPSMLAPVCHHVLPQKLP